MSSEDTQTDAPPVRWGTNREGGPYYAGRVHVLDPNRPSHGRCGLPITDVWELRPPVPDHLCPDCCIRAMAASYPPFATAPREAGDAVTSTGRFAALPNRSNDPVVSLNEQTIVMPVFEPGDDP